MNESERPFFPDIFEEKIRKCDEIEDPQRRRDCKIDILVDAVKKIGVNQKPVSWWLEVISEGTKPLFDEVKDEIGVLKTDMTLVKEDVGSLKTNMTLVKEDVGGLKTNMTLVKEDVGGLKTNMTLVKEDMDIRFNAVDVRLGKIREEMATKDDISEVREDIKKLDDGIGAISAHLGIGNDINDDG